MSEYDEVLMAAFKLPIEDRMKVEELVISLQAKAINERLASFSKEIKISKKVLTSERISV